MYLDLEGMTLSELKEEAKNLGIKRVTGIKKDELTKSIKIAIHEKNLAEAAEKAQDKTPEPPEPEGDESEGILEIMADGYGFLRTKNFEQGDNDIYISQSQIRRFNLRTGDNVKGITRQAREGERYGALLYVKSVNGDNPQKAVGRPVFENLTPIYPCDKLKLETSKDEISGRIIDLVAPIGKGQRGMIVAPPKVGKTILLTKMANAITKNHKEVSLIMLLIDGGSLTVLATALIDTGSKMDEVIFEEFKGTGNMELVLDRKLSERRIFPAIDVNKSGTRREDLLLSKEELEAMYAMRKMSGNSNAAESTPYIIEQMRKTDNNAMFVEKLLLMEKNIAK